MRVCFHTLGCKVNQYETQSIREIFEEAGYTVVDDDTAADVIVINSCSVTAESDRKVRQLLRRCRKSNADAVTVLTGCMVQAFPELAAALTEADIVLGNRDHSNIVGLVERFSATKTAVFDVEKHRSGDPFNTRSVSDFEERTRAYMKIEDGCDRFCSYCIIPYARGRVRSKPVSEIKAEAERLAEKGFREIVLVGINLSAYGKGEDDDLCDAARAVASVEGIERVRLGSLEPDHITDEMLGRLKAIPEFCPQFHLSLQSGCDETLTRMNRRYDTAFYRDLVNRIRRLFPDCSVTTDIMVGFAGETEDEFAKSISFVESIGFARAHIFPYSPRKGTLAASFKGMVTNREKAERAKRMSEVVKKCEKAFLQNFSGKKMPVLFEAPEGEYAVGYTENYIRVKVRSDADLTGEMLNIIITETFDDYCTGVIAEDS